MGSPGGRNDARQTDTTVVMENKHVKYDILLSEIDFFKINSFHYLLFFFIKIG